MDKANMYWQIYLNLENEVLNLSKYIYFTDTNIKINNETKQVEEVSSNQIFTYSTTIADLLVRCCIEIESLSKELYHDNGGEKPRGSKDIYFDNDCIALLNKKWNLDDKEVLVSAVNFYFRKDENKILRPLKNAGKSSKAYWAKAYQAVKHDRYNNLYLGNIKALLQAIAALYLLNIYYRDEKITEKYREYGKVDMSFGSKIFSLKEPNQNYITAVINGEDTKEIMHSKSTPYILKYTDSTYKELREVVSQTQKEMTDYFFSQPEIKEAKFIQQINESIEREKIEPHHRMIHFCELCRYRMNKKLPKDMPFNDRKVMFLDSEERKRHIARGRRFLKEEEITEDNLQKEIDLISDMAGFDMCQLFEQKKLRLALYDSYCELVLDKGNVKYEN